MFLRSLPLLIYAYLAFAQPPTRLVITNDDGWAVANIRAANDALKAGGYNVVLSAPAQQQSGTGSSPAPPTPLTQPCQFNTCPTGSPAEGFNASDPRLNYVNSFPVDAVRFGINTLAPQFFDGAKPDFVVSGPNVGSNLGSGITGSGTVGAASEAALEGIPSTAFSAFSSLPLSYTTLSSSPTSANTLAALLYASLTTTFTTTLLAPPSRPILPPGISINVNFGATLSTTGLCTSPSDFKFVLTRVALDLTAVDVKTCGSVKLPLETAVISSTVLGGGCWASVSVINATTKGDVGRDSQAFVLDRLGSFLSCFPA